MYYYSTATLVNANVCQCHTYIAYLVVLYSTELMKMWSAQLLY